MIGLTLLAPVLLCACSTPRIDHRAATLVEESGVALHVAALRTIRIVHLRGTVVASGLSGSGDHWNEMGGAREASLFSTPPLGGGSGWDGNENWNLDQTGLVIVDGSVLGRSTAIDEAYVDDDDLWTPHYGGAAVAWDGAKVQDGTAYDVLAITPRGSSVPMDVWFDGKTHLPVTVVQTAGPLVSTTSMADFHRVGGLMIPYRIDTSDNEGDSTSFVATSVVTNPAGGAAHLAAPTSRPHDFSIANHATQTTVPIRVSENHVYVNVMLDGKGPYRFEFDTGGANVVDTAVAKAIGATSGGSVQVGGVGNSTESSSFATIETLRIGAATVTNQVFVVLPLRKAGVAAGMARDGVIGYEVLSRFVTTFDYARKRVVFRMPGTYSAPTGASVVPIAQYGTQPEFACGIDGVRTTCTLDTGARDAISLFTPFVREHPSVVPPRLTAIGVNGFGVGGPTMGRLGRVRTLAFGGFALHDLVGDYTMQTKGGFAMPFIGANVGGAVWRRFTMTLDYHRRTMTLAPNAELDVRDHWDRSGVFLIDNGAITIVDVRPGTPAARAGLAKGDVIVAVDGSATLSLSGVRATFLRAPGTVVHVLIRKKDDTTRDVTLTLADYV